MSKSSQFGRRVTGVSALTAAVALALAPPAFAAPSEAILDAVPPLSTTVVYGEYWQLPFASTHDLRSYPAVTLAVSGIPGGRDGFASFGWVPTDGNFDDWRLSLVPTTPAVIGVGTYRVSVELWAAYQGPTQVHAVTRAPQSLTVTPAEVVADLRVAPDRADPQNTVVTMRLGGNWLDSLVGTEYLTDYGQANLSTTLAPPGGVWQLTIRDADGEVVADETFEVARGELPAASMLWTTSPAGETFTAETTFTVASGEASNFSVVQAEPVTFTTGEATRPDITAPVVPAPPAADEAGGVSIPVWALIVTGLVALGVVVTALLVGLRRTARSVAPPEESSAVEPSEGTTESAAKGEES